MARQYETFAGAGMDSSTKNLMYRKMESAFNALEKGQGFDGGTTEIFEKTAGLVAFYRGCGHVSTNTTTARTASCPDIRTAGIIRRRLSGNEAGTGRYRVGYVVGARAGDDVYAARGAKGTARLAGFVQQLYFSVELAEYHKDEVRSATIWRMRRRSMCLIWTASLSLRRRPTAIPARLSPTARIDQLAEKRRKGKIKRAEMQSSSQMQKSILLWNRLRFGTSWDIWV